MDFVERVAFVRLSPFTQAGDFSLSLYVAFLQQMVRFIEDRQQDYSRAQRDYEEYVLNEKGMDDIFEMKKGIARQQGFNAKELKNAKTLLNKALEARDGEDKTNLISFLEDYRDFCEREIFILKEYIQDMERTCDKHVARGEIPKKELASYRGKIESLQNSKTIHEKNLTLACQNLEKYSWAEDAPLLN